MGSSLNKKRQYTIEDIKKLDKKDFTPKEKFILLLGETGKGKSTFINEITGKNECLEGDDTEAVTQAPIAVPFDYEGYNLYFIDSPGLNDKRGDVQNLKHLGNLRDLPRLSTFILILNYNDLRITQSIQTSLLEFMKIFPSKKFWDNVIIVRNWSFNDSRKGKILEGIQKDSILMECMRKNNINFPEKIKEFYVDFKDDNEKKKTIFSKILNIIKDMDPIYKDIKINENYEFIEKNEMLTVKFIKTTTYIDFNDRKETFKETRIIGIFNMNQYKPKLIIVKREKGPCRNKFLCWCKQYYIKYVCYKTYDFNGVKKTYTFLKEEAWEDEDNEINGEQYRQKLERQENSYNRCLFNN